MHTDVLLGLLLRLVGGPRPVRPDLAVVVASATLDHASLASFFAAAPHGLPAPGPAVARVAGRQHHVRVLYAKAPEEDYVEAALCAVLQFHQTEPLPGDFLVFLTGAEEIEAVAQRLRDHAAGWGGGDDGAGAGGGAAVGRPNPPPPLLLRAAPLAPMLVAPLYAALAPEAQAAVFEPPPPGTRKVVLATNVAETSLTIPGITLVVDPGMAKQRSTDHRSGVDALAVGPISRAAARQRAGRAGRERPGTVLRLYTEAAFFDLMAPCERPEVTRCHLGGVVLQLKASAPARLLARSLSRALSPTRRRPPAHAPPPFPHPPSRPFRRRWA